LRQSHSKILKSRFRRAIRREEGSAGSRPALPGAADMFADEARFGRIKPYIAKSL
jgi:hypothetical protein